MNTKYMNPYLAGFFLGLVLLVTIFVTGRGLGASGALKSVVVEGVSVVSPSHLASSSFYKDFSAGHSGSPLKQWLVFEVAGVAIGAFLSGTVSRRLTWITEKGPHVTICIYQLNYHDHHSHPFNWDFFLADPICKKK